MTHLHYYQCQDCLSIGTHEQFVKNAECSICNGRINHLGRTVENKKHLHQEKARPACDGRCTQATGPKCYCTCGCANHGSGRMVMILVNTRINKARLEMHQNNSAPDAWHKANDYRFLRDEVKNTLHTKYPSLKVGGQHSQEAWMEDWYAKTALNLASKSTNHKKRIQILQDYIKKLAGNSVELPSEQTSTECDWRPDYTIPEDYYAA